MLKGTKAEIVSEQTILVCLYVGFMHRAQNMHILPLFLLFLITQILIFLDLNAFNKESLC